MAGDRPTRWTSRGSRIPMTRTASENACVGWTRTSGARCSTSSANSTRHERYPPVPQGQSREGQRVTDKTDRTSDGRLATRAPDTTAPPRLLKLAGTGSRPSPPRAVSCYSAGSPAQLPAYRRPEGTRQYAGYKRHKRHENRLTRRVKDQAAANRGDSGYPTKLTEPRSGCRGDGSSVGKPPEERGAIGHACPPGHACRTCHSGGLWARTPPDRGAVRLILVSCLRYIVTIWTDHATVV